MIEYFAPSYCEAYLKLARMIDALHAREKDDRTKPPADRLLSGGYRYFVAQEALTLIVPELQRLDFDTELVNRAKLLHGRLCDSEWRSYTAEAVLDAMIEIRSSIGKEFHKRKFAYIRPPNDQYFEQDKLFGDRVYEQFSSARRDIKDAGNCLAAELWTASVFHLMRVGECGLRALCYDRRVALTKNKPIDLATWDDLLKELEKVESKIQNYPRTLARDAQFEFYHGAMMELKRFKNLYRNKVSHYRGEYDEHEAVGAFHHVKAFMGILAKRIGEGQRTPEIWKGTKWTKEI